jgi:adenine deaminase
VRGRRRGHQRGHSLAREAANSECEQGCLAYSLLAGLTVEIRGSRDYLLPDVVKAINSLPVVPASLTVCTDDVFPQGMTDGGTKEIRAGVVGVS